MNWNYRVIVKDAEYGIYEVYYEDSGSVCGLSESSVVPVAGDLIELRERLQTIADALNDSVLRYEDIASE